MGNYEIKIKYNYICVVCVVTTKKAFTFHDILFSDYIPISLPTIYERIVLITNMKSYNNNDI